MTVVADIVAADDFDLETAPIGAILDERGYVSAEFRPTCLMRRENDPMLVDSDIRQDAQLLANRRYGRKVAVVVVAAAVAAVDMEPGHCFGIPLDMEPVHCFGIPLGMACLCAAGAGAAAADVRWCVLMMRMAILMILDWEEHTSVWEMVKFVVANWVLWMVKMLE